MKTNEKRLIADIDIEIHQRIKVAAAWRNITIKDYVLMAIVESLIKDEQYQ